jgi:hypothetical protein
MTVVPDTDMHAAAFFLADYASVESGKVYASGAFWNRLNFPTYPTMVSFSVVAVIVVPWRAHHQMHKFTVAFEDADGRPLGGQFEGEFQLGTTFDHKAGDNRVVPLAMPVSNIVLERAGDYAAVLAVDGAEIARWRFGAVQFATGHPIAPESPNEGQ